jgi:creatinine amidohydrolase
LLASGRAKDVVAVLPVAATEQHGPHLPLNVDTTIVDGVIRAALDHLPANSQALFLPTQAVGFSPEHAAFPGTLTLKAETVLRLWTELAECVATAGVRKFMIFNAHGGQSNFMDIVARDLRARLGMMAFSVNWYAMPLLGVQGEDVNALLDAKEHRFGIHAGQMETSLMLALNPYLVDMSVASDFESSAQLRAREYEILGNGKTAKFAWQIQDYNESGAVGNAASATAQLGQQTLKAAGKALARLLGEMERIPLSTLVERLA